MAERLLTLAEAADLLVAVLDEPCPDDPPVVWRDHKPKKMTPEAFREKSWRWFRRGTT